MGNEDLVNMRDMTGMALVLQILDEQPKVFFDIFKMVGSLKFSSSMVNSREEITIDFNNAKYTFKATQISLLSMILARLSISPDQNPFEVSLNKLIGEVESQNPSRKLIRLYTTKLKKALNSALVMFFGTDKAIISQATMDAKGKILPLKSNMVYDEGARKLVRRKSDSDDGEEDD